MISLPFYSRCHRPRSIHRQSPLRYWTSSWINTPTGRPRTGASHSKVFSGRSSAVHPKHIWRCHETLYQFCSSYTIPDPFPVSELTLCYFFSYLAEQGLAPQTGRAYLAAVRNAQISLGLPDPREQSSLPLLKRVQAGIRRIRLQKGSNPGRIRLPITVHTLARIREVLLSSSQPNRVVMWAVACTAFFGFFRLGELLPISRSTSNAATDLSWGDVAVDDRSAPPHDSDPPEDIEMRPVWAGSRCGCRCYGHRYLSGFGTVPVSCW